MDPVTIAAIASAGGGALGNLLSGPKEYSAAELNPDQGGLLQEAYQQYRTPTSSLPFYQRLLSDRSGFQKNAMLATAAATGGSQAVATKRAEAQGRTTRDRALQAAQGTYLQSQGLAMDALRQQMQNKRFAIQGATQSKQAKRAHRAQFFDQIAGMGTGLLGDKYGAQAGAQQSAQQSANPAFGRGFNPSQFQPYTPSFGSPQGYRSTASTGLLNY